jgi:glycosyltransferase involved in cell wall biosynthesis
MACEVVPIATNVGGVPELIDDGETGFLADVGDVDTMARCAIELLSDRTKLKEMASLARKRARERFCASKIIPQYEKFYQSVIDGAK